VDGIVSSCCGGPLDGNPYKVATLKDLLGRRVHYARVSCRAKERVYQQEKLTPSCLQISSWQETEHGGDCVAPVLEFPCPGLIGEIRFRPKISSAGIVVDLPEQSAE
jgi:hypothetical protein